MMTSDTLTLSAWTARRLPDDDVFERTVQGDSVAFSELYRRYHKRIYGYCLARSLDPETAADATQEVFIRLLRAEPGSIDSPRAWLFAVARNAVIDVGRKRARQRETGEIDEDTPAWQAMAASDTADEVVSRAEGKHAFLALRRMNARYRTALILREIHGQSSKDMAEALGTTTGAVDTLVSRARDAFGVAYAGIGDLPAACRASVELIYRRGGTGITDGERHGLEAHLASCRRCRTEAKRAESPRHLAALLPFLIPASSRGVGLLRRAAMAGQHLPPPSAVELAASLPQPHTWNLGAKLAAGLLATALIATPVAGTLIQRQRLAANVGMDPSSTLRGGSGHWPSASTMWSDHAAGSGTGHDTSGGKAPHSASAPHSDAHTGQTDAIAEHDMSTHAGTGDLTPMTSSGAHDSGSHTSAGTHSSGSTAPHSDSTAPHGETPPTAADPGHDGGMESHAH